MTEVPTRSNISPEEILFLENLINQCKEWLDADLDRYDSQYATLPDTISGLVNNITELYVAYENAKSNKQWISAICLLLERKDTIMYVRNQINQEIGANDNQSQP